MAKIETKRLDGIWGMRKFTASELHEIADYYQARISDPENTDDPKWLQRRADRIRRLAVKKEKSQAHKLGQ